ncbi:MAG: peptidylprolyl isomerase [bacterium]|nr:peptidylprolyl isomerase [bacterium]
MLKKIFLTSITLLTMASLTACGDSAEPADAKLPAPSGRSAILETDLGDIEIGFYENEVPEMAKNFIELAKAGKYDNTPFHRVVKDFVIQGGDFTNRSGTGGYSYKGPGTELAGEFHPSLSNLRGSLSWANKGPDTNGSQFFINLKDNSNLDHDKAPLTSQHPVFAVVTKGMKVVEKIVNAGKTVNIVKVTLGEKQ